MLDVILEQPMGEKFVMSALANTDLRLREDKPASPAFLFAALLWHEVLSMWNAQLDAGKPAIPSLHLAMDAVLHKQRSQMAIPHRHDAIMKEIWLLQPRLEQRSGQRPLRLLALPRFRAAYDFLLLRCQSGEMPMELGEWWTEFQDADDERRDEMLLPEKGPKKKRRRTKKPASAAAA
jgi:poly(A) polymerase